MLDYRFRVKNNKQSHVHVNQITKKTKRLYRKVFVRPPFEISISDDNYLKFITFLPIELGRQTYFAITCVK